MRHGIFRPSLGAYRTAEEATPSMAAAFARRLASHEALLAADAASVGDALLSAWADTGLLDVRILARTLYGGAAPVVGFPARGDAWGAAKPVLAEGWASLVSRGYVAEDPFEGGWFVTRAGAEVGTRG